MVDCCMDPWKPPRLAALSFPCFPTIVSIPCIGKTSAPFQASLLLPPFLLADSNPSFLPSFLPSLPLFSWRQREIWMVEGGRGTVILEGARGSYRNAKISPFVQVISIEWQTSNPERHLLSPLMDTKTFSSLVSKCFFFFCLYNYELQV